MKYLFIFGLSMAMSLHALAQTNIAGKVVDESGEPIGFAHIYNLSNGLGKISDINGKFDLIANKGDTIQFSYVGYKTYTLFVDIIHLSSYLKVELPEDPLLLPSITIYADENFKVPMNPKLEPIFLQGITKEIGESKYRPGKITPGTSPGVGGIPGGGVTINGPITYFSKDEREKRKAVEAKRETKETITYQKFIAQDSVKNTLMYLYQIDSSQYNRVVRRMNLQNPGVQRSGTVEEAWHWVIAFFDEAVPVIKVFDMH